MKFPLVFAMPLVFRGDLQGGTPEQRTAYIAWHRRFQGKTVYLVGWCDEAFAVVDELGSYSFEFIRGSPQYLFVPKEQP